MLCQNCVLDLGLDIPNHCECLNIAFLHLFTMCVKLKRPSALPTSIQMPYWGSLEVPKLLTTFRTPPKSAPWMITIVFHNFPEFVQELPELFVITSQILHKSWKGINACLQAILLRINFCYWSRWGGWGEVARNRVRVRKSWNGDEIFEIIACSSCSASHVSASIPRKSSKN